MFPKDDFHLRLIQSCPVCGRDYQEPMLRLLGEGERDMLAHLTCGQCQSKLLIKVLLTPNGVIGNALLTDLFPEEVDSFRKSGAIDANYVLAVHDYLFVK
jgi:hypothetical protein